MSDFSVTTLFVVPTGNTLPVSGSTNNLSGTQFGIFRPDNSVATAANVGSSKYIYLAQGRNIYTANEGTIKSDLIYAGNVTRWEKIPGTLVQLTQVTQVSALTANCNEDISLTLRLDSFYIRTAYANGLTRSVMVTTPCCNCGSNPCDTLSADDIEATMIQLAQNINDDEILQNYVVASTSGTGTSTVINIQGLTLQVYGQGTSVDLTNFPYQQDRMYFWTFVYSGPELTTDYNVLDACNPVATVTIAQRASYPINTPAEIKQLEKDYWPYQHEYKHIFPNVNFNGEFQTYVDSALAYDLYYIQFYQPRNTGMEVGVVQQDETVCIAIPQGDTNETATIAVLTAFLGTCVNEVATPSTTSTFTTNSTTTTSTTMNPTP